ncbi:MAG: indolepyruvate oxidoreductase subunit beta family protein [Burkholderiales bacterium]|nr:indolepyruvate oxidoreductase subunit beta family protein [Burkholderiales bacterium]
MNAQRRSLLIAAVGGQGGAVLTGWIVQAARSAGLVVQATSTPGVSQRTGATTYYVETAPAPEPGAPAPVLALMPLPGRVDVLLASELLEAARMLERGMVTPERTTVIASTHRILTAREKMSIGDGRFDSERIVGAIRALTRRAVLFDMEAVRMRHDAAISAALFGALAGSGALPLPRDACEDAIRAAGRGVGPSLAAFADAFDQVASTDAGVADEPRAARAPADEGTALPAALAQRVARLPIDVAQIAKLGALRTLGFQGAGYTSRYIDRVEAIQRAESALGAGVPASGAPVSCATARSLALWMCYDDVIRVASLKARRSRLARIRNEVQALPGDVVRVRDVFHPRREEVAAILPRALGAWLGRRRRTTALRGRGIALQTTSVTGALALRLTAALRPLRPWSLRFAAEQAEIDDWLAVVEQALAVGGSEAALAVARLPRLRKGYGDTQTGSTEEFRRVLATCREGGATGFAAAVEALRATRTAGQDGRERGAPVPKAQPMIWTPARKGR